MADEASICVVVCENHRRDLEAVLAGGGFDGVDYRVFPARCFPGLEGDSALAEFFADLSKQFSKLDVLAGPCLARLTSLGEGSDSCRIHVIEPPCLPAVDERMAADFAVDGAYLLTAGWLEGWRGHMEAMGLDRDKAREFFADTCEVLTLFDTGVYPDSVPELARLGEWLSRPTRRIPVGLGRFRLFLSQIVTRRRIEDLERRRAVERADSQRRLADYEAVYDMLSGLTRFVDKDEVVQAVFDLFAMVFGASRCAFAVVTGEGAQVLAARPEGGQIDPRALTELRRSRRAYRLHDEGDGFLLELRGPHGEGFVIEVARLAVPERSERYVGLALPVARVFVLAFANACAVEEHLALQETLAHDQRLKATGTLASGVAHEINNPLAVILNYADLLRDELPSEGVSAEYVEQIVAHAERIATIVTRLADFARQGDAPRILTRVDWLVDSALALLRPAFQSDGIQAHREVPDDLPLVPCDQQAIQQVLVSLLKNAQDALNERFPGESEEKIVIVSAERSPGEDFDGVRVTVENRGVDVSDDARQRLFEPFFTTRSRSTHAGLGLSAGHSIVASHGGHLSFESDPGRGTRFYFDLPVEANRA